MTMPQMPALPDLAVANLSGSLDPVNLDQRLQALSGVTSTWSFPQLPDNVTLDLATSNLLPDTGALTQFTQGVAYDLDQAQKPEPVVLPPNPTQTRLSALYYPEDDPVTRVRQMFSAVAGKPAPSLISDQAVVKIKQRALAAGLLAPDTQLDGSWSPELNSVKWQLGQQDFKNRLQGDRTGAMKTNQMLGLLDKWTSPTGLLTAASSLGFVPDVGKIKSETKNWGKKISDWWNNDRSNPIKMVQALSGPIDDVMFPVVNTALLFSGVGNIVTFSRFAQAGKLAMTAKQLQNAQATGRFLMMGGDIATQSSRAQRLFGLAINEAHAAAEFGRATAPGILSSRLMSSRFAVPEAIGKGMAAWRNSTSTVIAKKAVQQGMKLGLVSNLEHDFQGEKMDPVFDFRSWAYGEHTNPLTMGIASFGEIALTPTSVLNRGALTNPIKDRGAALSRKLSYLPQDQRIGVATLKALEQHVKYADPAKYAGLQKITKGANGQTRQQAALRYLLNAGSDEDAGMRMMALYHKVALDKWADLKTIELGIDRFSSPDEYWETWHVMRNKVSSQLLDLSDVAEDLDSEANREMFARVRSHIGTAELAGTGSDLEKIRAQRFRTIMEDLNTPEGKAVAMAELQKNAAVRRGTYNEVMGVLEEADIVRGVAEHYDHLSRWTEYTTALDRVRSLDTKLVSVAGLSDDFEASWRWSALGEELSGAKGIADDIDSAWVNDLSLQLNEGRGRLGLAKLDTPSRQDAELLEAHVHSLLAQLKGADAKTTRSINQRLRDLNNSPLWGDLKVEPEHTTIESKLARLAVTKKRIAKQVNVPNEVAEQLQATGYKAVYGVEFAFPQDVLDLMGPMPYIANSTMRKHSLGLFLGRDNQAHNMLGTLRDERFKNIVSAELNSRHGRDIDGEELLQRLRQARLNLIDIAGQDAAESAGLGLTNRMGSRIKNADLPFSTFRLEERKVREILPDFTPEEVKTVVASLRKAENLGFEYLGLQKFENDLVANSWLRGTLKAFTSSPASDGLGPGQRIVKNPASWGSWKTSVQQVLGGTGSPTATKRVATGALLGAGAAVNSEEDKGLAGALGAGLGAAFPRVISPKTMARLMLAQGARIGADRLGADETQSNVLGLMAPFAAAKGARFALSKQGWGEYSRLGDKARHLRDLYRFSLSPVWDIQRYTEGAALAATTDLGVNAAGKRIVLPVTTRPMRRAMQDTGMSKEEIVTRFKQASRGYFDIDAVESAQKWSHEVGIMGYNPTEWMAATHAQLVRQGLSADDAATKALEIYTYGVKGRSAAELSVNFVFFPFSFQKKYLGNMAKFLSQDMGRTVMLHDSLKMWNDLYERYDLEKEFREHVPMMNQMRKINALAFGISPGEFGGINRPIYELVHRLPAVNEVHDAIVNTFLPQGLQIDTQSTWRDLQPHVKRMLPVWRDAQDMYEDLQEQHNVMVSPTHQTTAVAAEQGWNEWRKINEEINSYATALGTTYGGIMQNEDYGFIKSQIERKRAVVMQKYPEFVESRQAAAQRAIEKQDEIKRIVSDPSGPDEVAMQDFNNYVEQYRDVMALSGIDLTDDIDAVPAFVFDALRRRAISLGQQSPGFNRLYRIYYSGIFGPIEYQVV